VAAAVCSVEAGEVVEGSDGWALPDSDSCDAAEWLEPLAAVAASAQDP